ncbi:MAG: hypothetical protein KAH32_05200 [Chlamydiia bacterium]|nr:hypothetical protein [Chlamydiia bacterium]
MFNTGYKELIITSKEGITKTGNVVNIPGFGNADIVGVTPVTPQLPTGGSATLAGYAAPASGEEDVKITLRKRNSSSTVNIGFNATGGDWQGAYDKWKTFYNTSETPELASVSSGNIVLDDAAFKYEVVKVTTKEVKGLEYFPVNNLEVTWTDGTLPIGQGWQIEESHRMGTFQNFYPYAQAHGGNVLGYSMDDQFYTYVIENDESVNPGFEQHEYVKHDFINAAMPTTKIKMTIFSTELL